MKHCWQLPNLLTLSRLVVSPLILPLLIYYLLPYESLMVNLFLGALFLLFNLTDFFDGYLARKFKQETKVGSLLDPIADKFLTFSVLIALVAAGKLFFYWAVIFIGRDFFMMGLRLVSLEHKFSLSVSYLAKLKTAVLMAYITVVILNPSASLWQYTWFNSIELGLLFVALFLSLWTAVEYFQLFAKHYSAMEEQ